MKLLFESKRDDFLLQYVDLLKKKGIETNLGQLKGYLLNKFSNQFGMHALSKGGNYYLCGVSRYYFDGQLTTNKRLNVLYPNVQDKPINDVCVRLDALIDILRNAYIDSVGTKFEQPEDFGTLPLDKLLKKYNKKINDYLGISTPKTKEEEVSKVDPSTQAGKNYTYEILYSYDEAKQFEQYTKPGAWCITYGQQHYNAYVRRLNIHYVVFMRKGYENIPRKVGKGFTKQKPHDEYGNSLICVLQSNSSPEPVYITSRWNHGSTADGTQGTEADHAYTKEEFLKVIGCDESVLKRCFDQWLENKNEKKKDNNSQNREEKKEMLRNFKYAQMMLNNGGQIKDLFTDGNVLAGDYKKPMKCVALMGMKNEETGNKWFTIMDRGQLKFDQFFVKNDNQWSGRPDFVLINNTVISLTTGKKTAFYSIKKKSFLSADGVMWFSHLSYDLQGRSIHNTRTFDRYYMLAASGNQIAVLDTQMGDFITAPNNAKIFESVIPCQGERGTWNSHTSNRGYSGKIYIMDIPNNGYLVMTYDSAARLVFIYDLTTNKFLNLPGIIVEEGVSKVPGEVRVWTVRIRGYEAPSGYVIYENSLDYYRNCYKLLNINTGEALNIKGYTIFRDFRNCGNMVYAFWPKDLEKNKNDQYNDLDMFYDVQKGDILKIDGQPVIGSLKDFDYSCGYVLISPERNSYVYVYNPYTKTFYKDNEGNILFYYRSTYTNDKIELCYVAKEGLWKGVVKDSFSLPPAKEAAAMMHESVERNFYDTLNKLFKIK